MQMVRIHQMMKMEVLEEATAINFVLDRELD
jgi:hypothetical protein